MKTKILLLASMLALTACIGGEHDDLNNWMNEQKQAAKQKVKKPVAPEPVQPVTYVSHGLIIPHEFNERRMRTPSTSSAPNVNRAKELLENYPLQNLKFVGSVKSDKGLSALIDVGGHVYTVRVGNYVGENYGRITAISQDSITVTEKVENADGGWDNRHIQLDANGVVADPEDATAK